jgi:MoaA/NifB/PqqE/SkfB family radical SAM enzyme
MIKNVINSRFTWLTHYHCNYRCPYCFYYEGCGWDILKERNKYASLNEWNNHWKRLYRRYGRFAILITGGEPFTYPNFIEIVRDLSGMHYPVNITTNASGDLKKFVRLVNSEKVSITVSFHPDFDTLNSFLEKARFLRDNGFKGCTNLLAYPPYIRNIEFYMQEFDKIKERLKVIPFRGIYKGNAYPWSYSEEEIEIMAIDPDWFNKIRKKGKICQAGRKTAELLPDGAVARCGQLFYNGIIGNFFDGNFELLPEDRPCNLEICPCDEDKIFEEGDLMRSIDT